MSTSVGVHLTSTDPREEIPTPNLTTTTYSLFTVATYSNDSFLILEATSIYQENSMFFVDKIFVTVA